MPRLLILILIVLVCLPAVAQTHPGTDAFLQAAQEKYDLPPDEVRRLLESATYQPTIVEAMRRPAEGKPWHAYRPIFLTDERIEAGVEFWEENKDLIDEVSAEFGVEPHYILAIVGVETYYGRITGSYRVLDSLATLGFYYPTDTGRDRSDFFSDELMQFILLTREERLPPSQVTGSYAGAMGLGQFIPSSYRAYSVDFDGDGRRDLWSSTPDALASVANYLRVHGWRTGEPVALPAEVYGEFDSALIAESNFLPKISLIEIERGGFQSEHGLDPATQAAVVALEQKNGDEHWVTFQNFYVITRYNRSALYAMAVHQLSQALLEEMQG